MHGYWRLSPTRFPAGDVPGAKCHSNMTMNELLVVVVFLPCPPNEVSRIPTRFVFAEKVPNVDAIRDVPTTSPYPAQSVSANIASVEQIPPVSALKERT
jgi:hypothetical protein